MKLLRPLAGYTLHDHKTNDFIRRELKITGILDKTDEYRLNWHLHLQRMPQKRIPLLNTKYNYQSKHNKNYCNMFYNYMFRPFPLGHLQVVYTRP